MKDKKQANIIEDIGKGVRDEDIVWEKKKDKKKEEEKKEEKEDE